MKKYNDNRHYHIAESYVNYSHLLFSKTKAIQRVYKEHKQQRNCAAAYALYYISDLFTRHLRLPYQ